ncbi:MAG: single-stranded-DNA-specific exonuclease RecJ [bacterium]|jgi:single-stranded-DNA-specific exonuclease|nr:single-stranded-DNA-specific exonuclease RecJ [bacterium]
MTRPWVVRSGPWSEGDVAGRIARSRGLDPALEQRHDPFLMAGMADAVGRLRRAIDQRERILVFGDYDADGVTAATLLRQGLADLGARVAVRLPHRVGEGYGLQGSQVEEIIAAGAKLLITADNGSSAHEALALAARSGLDVIVVDHHHCPAELPPAVAVLNPRRADCPYPFKSLAAVGVAWKLLAALDWPGLEEGLDLVALGTVADLATLKGENRLLVREGLARIRQGGRPGLAALLALPGATREGVDARTLGWQLGPRINCAGRLAEADLAWRLLEATEAGEARTLAERLDTLNQERRRVQDEAVRQAEQVLRESAELPAILIFVGRDWHLGVIGLIAGRLCQSTERPVLVMSRVLGTGLVKGSARSVPGLHITEAIARHAHLLESYGGHAEAAGLSIREEQLPAFIEGLGQDVAEAWSGIPAPSLVIDSAVAAAELDLTLPVRLQALEPCGAGNPRPRLGIFQARVERFFEIGGGKHLKCWVQAEGRRLEAVWWSQGAAAASYQVGQEVDLAFAPQVNSWNGRTELQLVIEALRPARPPLIEGD